MRKFHPLIDEAVEFLSPEEGYDVNFDKLHELSQEFEKLEKKYLEANHHLANVTEALRKEREGMKTAYMCGVDWQCELGEVPDHTKVYSSIESLKEQRTCWKECGIVEVTVKLTQWVEPQDLVGEKL